MTRACKISKLLNICNSTRTTILSCAACGTKTMSAVLMLPSRQKNEARAVVSYTAEHHDAEQGINWLTLEAAPGAIRQ